MAEDAIFEYALRLGDNCLILGQRLGAWVGHAPVLEEDIALANVALDMIGQARMQAALDNLWPYAGEMFIADAVDQTMVAVGIAPVLEDIRGQWDAHVSQTLAGATLSQPGAGYTHNGGKRGVHTEHLGYLLAEMQFLQRAYPGATW